MAIEARMKSGLEQMNFLRALSCGHCDASFAVANFLIIDHQHSDLPIFCPACGKPIDHTNGSEKPSRPLLIASQILVDHHCGSEEIQHASVDASGHSPAASSLIDAEEFDRRINITASRALRADGSAVCPHCGRKQKHAAGLRRHLRRFHDAMIRIMPGDSFKQ